MKFRTLADLSEGSYASVVAIALDFGTRERLAALGLKPGRRVQVLRRVGCDGPLQVRIDHTDFVLRGASASQITVL